MTTFYLLLDFSNELNLPKENMILKTSFEWISKIRLSAKTSSLIEFFRAMNDTMENQAVLDR